ncbi:lactate racemase domain-containing protein [Pirellulaceae bacterium SH467]
MIEALAGSLKVTLPVSKNLLPWSHGRAASRNDYSSMIQEQLENPIDFPSLMLAVIPDDRIAIALEEGVPDGIAIACELIRYLLQHGCDSDRVCWVLGTTSPSIVDAARDAMAAHGIDGIRLVAHDPQDQENHAYIAASESADPIYVQRELIDADVVLPIYCIRTAECPYSSDLFGISPSFTDAATQQRWGLAWLDDNTTRLHQHEKLSREAGWLAGVQFALAVVPSVDGKVAEILAGKPESVFRKGIEQLSSLPEETYDLVIGIVDGAPQQQTWLSVARAAVLADNICQTDGKVVVCCDVRKATPGIRDLRSDSPAEQANKRLLRSHAEDAFPAAVLRSICVDRSVYLMSSLSSAETESLGFAFVDGLHSLEHLIEQSHRVCVIRGAQY